MPLASSLPKITSYDVIWRGKNENNEVCWKFTPKIAKEIHDFRLTFNTIFYSSKNYRTVPNKRVATDELK